MGLANDIHNAISTCDLQDRDDEFPFRHHLGASLFGHTCDRYLWYSFRWMREPSHSARIERLFRRGREAEAKIVRMLRRTGLTVSTTLPELCENLNLPVSLNSIDIIRGYGLNVYKPQVIEPDEQIRANFPPHLGGSMDGILHVPSNYVEEYGYFIVLELKTHNQKSFMKTIRNGESTQWTSPQHYVQGNAYATQTGCKYFIYVAQNKNTDELYLRDEAVQIHVTELNIIRANNIIYRQKATESPKTQEKWRCNMCDYKPICKDKQVGLVARNCRTCQHAVPQVDGSWHCTVFGNFLEKKQEIKLAADCPSYMRIV